MFAIPGIAALIVFILVRPQEFLPLLQRVPFLHLFAAFAVIGWVIDVRLRRVQPTATPVLPWAVAFLAWGVVTVAVIVPDQLIHTVLEYAILFALYGTIAHGIQRFRTFQIVAGVMALTCTFIAVVCVHQGLADPQCVGGQEKENELTGVPDGRPCDLHKAADDIEIGIPVCRGPDAEPGLDYRCEHVGLFGTYSVDGRVRYRGNLNDPNEVALVMAAGGISFVIAFLRRKRNPIYRFALVLGLAAGLTAIMMTQSRGGQVAMLLVFFVYLLRRYGMWAFVPAAVLAAPLLLLGGRSDAAADMSTQQRYEAWATGLNMFRQNPIFGVGAGQFAEHHYLTAHNSFVLTLAEMGLLGMLLFVAIIYLSMKSLIVGIRTLSLVAGSEAAQVWGMALLASLCATIFSISTLSFAYKPVLWILFGLIGAWTNCIRHHRPDFTVRLTWKDLTIIIVASLLYVGIVLPVFLHLKGEM
jgi:O-antigen ligase